MLVMWEVGKVSVMRGVVPAYLQVVLLGKPVVAVSKQLLALPLLSQSQVRAIPEMDDDSQGLAIKLKRDDPFNPVAPYLFDLNQPVSRQHDQNLQWKAPR